MIHLFRKAAILVFALATAGCGPSPPAGPDQPAAIAVDSPPAPDTPPRARTAVAPPNDTSLHDLEGRFVELQMGDYAHFILEEAQGERQSFYLNESIPAAVMAPYESGKMAGKKVRISWRWVEKEVPEAGGKERVREMVEVE